MKSIVLLEYDAHRVEIEEKQMNYRPVGCWFHQKSSWYYQETNFQIPTNSIEYRRETFAALNLLNEK